MEENKIVMTVKKTFLRKDEKEEKIIFERQDGEWVYHAPNAQNHTIEQLETILKELKKLNET